MGYQLGPIQQIHVKYINVTVKRVTKVIQRIENMDIPASFRQNAYTITKNNNKERTEEHREEMKRMTEHITNLISEVTLLNTKIYSS